MVIGQINAGNHRKKWTNVFMDTLTSSYSKQGQYSGVGKPVKSEIELGFLFMVTDLV